MGPKGDTSGLLSLLVSLHFFLKINSSSVNTWYTFQIVCVYLGYRLLKMVNTENHVKQACPLLVMTNKEEYEAGDA
jgi:DMSO/TMAO reductase YedYZ heme-binding membrane subunit